jgi:hypothetical protein
MKLLKNLVVLALISFLAINDATASRIKFIEISNLDQWEKFLFLAQENNLGILVELCDENLPACDQMHRTTFRDRNLARYINENFLSFIIDGRSEFGNQFMATFPVTAYPTYLFGSADEVFFEKIEGVVDAELFAKIAAESLEQKKGYPALVDKYLDNQLSREEWLQLLGITELNKGAMESQVLSREFMLTLDDSDLRDTTLWPFINKFCLALDNAIFRTILNDRSVVSHKIASFNFEDYFMNVFNFNLTLAIFERDSFMMERVIKLILPELAMKDNENDDLILRTRQAFFSETFNWDAYLEVTINYVEQKDSSKAQYFQAFAQELLENYEEPDAILTSEKLIDEALKLEQTFELLMLKAYLLANKGQIDDAQKKAFEARKRAVNAQQESEASRLINSLFDWNRR